MFTISKREETIIEHLRNGSNPSQIARALGFTNSGVHARINYLLANRLVSRTGNKKRHVYKVLVKPEDCEVLERVNRHTKAPPLRVDQEVGKVVVPAHIVEYLLTHYQERKHERTAIAKHLGIPKYQLNLYIMEMKLR